MKPTIPRRLRHLRHLKSSTRSERDLVHQIENVELDFRSEEMKKIGHHLILPMGNNIVGGAKLIDTYLVVNYGGQQFKGQVWQQSTNPVWINSYFALEAQQDEKIVVQLFESDTISDKLLGAFTISLQVSNLKGLERGRRSLSGVEWKICEI